MGISGIRSKQLRAPLVSPGLDGSNRKLSYHVSGNLITVDLLLKHVSALYAGGLKIRQFGQNRHHHIAELNVS